MEAHTGLVCTFFHPADRTSTDELESDILIVSTLKRQTRGWFGITYGLRTAIECFRALILS